MDEQDPTRLVRTVVVDAPVEQAFWAFVDRFDEVKPREHNLLGSPLVGTTFEPRVGGTLHDRAEDGSECHWGRVLVFDPPHRLVFTWDIGPTWQLVDDPARASEVEVTFELLGDGRTRLRLEHRHLDRHGPGWEGVASGVGEDGGWPLYLQRFAALVPSAT